MFFNHSLMVFFECWMMVAMERGVTIYGYTGNNLGKVFKLSLKNLDCNDYASKSQSRSNIKELDFFFFANITIIEYFQSQHFR
jgi:hypothetical protein